MAAGGPATPDCSGRQAAFNTAGQAWFPARDPSGGLHSATALGLADPTGYVGSWFLNAYAICA